MAITVMQDNQTKDQPPSISSVLSRSWGSTPYAEAHKLSKYVHKSEECADHATATGKQFNDPKQHADAYSVLTIPNTISWCDVNGTNYQLSVDKAVYDCLSANCETNDITWLHNYIRNKWECFGKMRYPYIISPDFYLLWKEVCGVTHELFADSINASGVLENFCSADTVDRRFGACGSWEDVEEIVDGGAGHPPFDKEVLKNLLIRMEMNVRKNRAYCRVLVLPYNKNGVLRRLVDSEKSEFEGEVLAVIEKGLLRFRHQEELFESRSNPFPSSETETRFHKYRSGYHLPQKRKQQKQDLNREGESLKVAVDHDAQDSDWVCESSLAIVIWMNENYRHKYPAPSDVEDVFLHWAVSNFGSAADCTLDMDAIDRAFPDRTRSGERKADIFAL